MPEETVAPAEQVIEPSILVDRYIKLRDRKAELDGEHKKSMARFTDAMERIENILLKHLNDNTSESVRTAAGTFFKQVKTTASPADWDGVLSWMLENPDERSAILEKRVSKSFVEAYLEAHNDLPPGVDVRRETVVQIRRS